MKKIWNRGIALAAALALTAALTGTAMGAQTAQQIDEAAADTAAWICQAVPEPQVGSIGGEWAVLGLARGGFDVPDGYYQAYYARVEEYLTAHEGVLHQKKYTEYARVILALTAIGRDPRDVAGYDLTKPLADYDKTVWQGINGPVWALIALDSGGYPMPEDPAAATQATRQMYVDHILARQRPDGGWSLAGEAQEEADSDPDVTGMALQALARYQDQPAVAQAVEKALACMSRLQDRQGGFASWGVENVESTVQMTVALCELGISLDDPRFVKEGGGLLDSLMSYYQSGQGFRHGAETGGSSQMASEQGLYALVAVQRAQAGRESLYRMTDVTRSTPAEGEAPAGLPGRQEGITPRPVLQAGRTFPDVADHPCREAVEALAARGIVDGKPGGGFDPEAGMTRAEFAAMVVRALGLPTETTEDFSDVDPQAWYAPYVGTAAARGIITGTGDGRFLPEGTITRQEAAVMTARAAKLCGLDTAMETVQVRDMLAQFTDYVTAAAWARPELAFCYQQGFLDQSDLDIRPQEPILRWEMAQMLFRLLESAKLL